MYNRNSTASRLRCVGGGNTTKRTTMATTVEQGQMGCVGGSGRRGRRGALVGVVYGLIDLVKFLA